MASLNVLANDNILVLEKRDSVPFLCSTVVYNITKRTVSPFWKENLSCDKYKEHRIMKYVTKTIKYVLGGLVGFVAGVFRHVAQSVASGSYIDDAPHYKGGHATEHEFLEANNTKYE